MNFNQDTKEVKIREAIVETVAFFDLFAYPLTDFELWQYSGAECDLLEIQRILNANRNSIPFKGIGLLENKNGFYFLRGRSEIVETRMRRYNYTDQKFKRAVWVAKFFKIIPWIKMIAVGNIIGTNNLKDESDIDLFIISEDRRIWLTRFFCAGFMKIVGLRPKEGEEKDKICLNFYVSEGGMDLRRLMLTKVGRLGESDGSSSIRQHGQLPRDSTVPASLRQLGRRVAPLNAGLQNDRGYYDIYFIFWLAGLVPIYESGGMYERFMAVNNWLKEYLPNWQPVKMVKRRKSGVGFVQIYHDIVDLLLGGLEQNVKKWQLKRMPASLKNIMNQDTRVVVNDQVLKLHANDRREEYTEKFRKRMDKVINNPEY